MSPANKRNRENVLLAVENLKKYFPIEKGFFRRAVGYVRAVDDVSFEVYRGETLGLVGETGCGKTTLGMTVLRRYAVTDGSIRFRLDDQNFTDITHLNRTDLRPYRREAQMIFQDPYSSLNARMTVQDIIAEPLVINNVYSRKEKLERVKHMMDIVGLDKKYLQRYPHAFSGGQRQRISIARALVLNPSFIVADEPTSALDVSVQAQILNLMGDLQQELGLTYLFISHDLSVVRYMCHRVGIMYLGRIVEIGRVSEVFNNPKHPYTQALIAAIPQPDPDKPSGLEAAPGEVGNPVNPPSGCAFHPRCPHRMDICSEVRPTLRKAGDGNFVNCHLYEDSTENPGTASPAVIVSKEQ